MARQERYKTVYKLAYTALMKFYPFTLEDLPGEEWKLVPDYEDYHVSTFGRVKSFKNGKVRVMTPSINGRGYLSVNLCKDGKPKGARIHRLVAQAFIPNLESKPEVNHIDGVKMNNYVGNLEWATNSENQRHAFATGLQVAPQGEERSGAKLTNKQARYIRENPGGLNIVELAEMFGVDNATVSLIQRGRKYKTAGGVVRGKKKIGKPRVPDNICEAIRAEYVRGSAEFGSYGLAKKYGIVQSTVIKILKER